jgi:4-hydroxy-tetrahydrodipicolinate reductase
MKIALIGYGKMGKSIEVAAIEKGHEIILRISRHNQERLTKENLQLADVAIEFTNAEAAYKNILLCLESGIPVISGTTGWLSDLPLIEKKCLELKGTFLYASNFSVGVNLFFEVNKKLAALMSSHLDYSVELEEIHHTQKKDAPSGTAITLAEQILEESISKTAWINDVNPAENEMLIRSKREGIVSGTHSVKYSSKVDDIEIIHTAHNRTGFAGGAILAAEFVVGKKGIFTMKEVLGI